MLVAAHLLIFGAKNSLSLPNFSCLWISFLVLFCLCSTVSLFFISFAEIYKIKYKICI